MPEKQYIEREATIEFVKQNTPHFDGETTMECVERSIRYAPTADVAEVKRGEWIKEFYHPYWCSCCKEIAPLDACGESHYKSNFCPNCGAKMDGKGKVKC